jgi:hypothetical protein
MLREIPLVLAETLNFERSDFNRALENNQPSR